MYTIPQTGKYAFRASKVFKWDTQAGTFATVDRVLTIQVYTNSTLSSLAFSWQNQQIGVVIPPDGLPDNPLYYVDDMTVTTPVWTIPAGHVVVVRFSYVVRVGLSLSISIVDGVFEYAAELLQCENIIDPSADNYPFKYNFQYPLCDNEWDLINANKPDIIRILGVDMYLSEITQSLKGIATFNLISNVNLIACDTQECCTYRVEVENPNCLTFTLVDEEFYTPLIGGETVRFGIGTNVFSAIFLAGSPNLALQTILDAIDAYSNPNLIITRVGLNVTVRPTFSTGSTELRVVIDTSASPSGGTDPAIEDFDFESCVSEVSYLQQSGDFNDTALTAIIPYFLQVLINQEWQNVTSQMVGNVWTLETCDQITEALIIDSEGNVIETLNVECL
jgi:hypothetical protein